MENFRIEKNVLVKYTGNESHVVVPDQVRAVGAQAFAFNTAVVSVKLPRGVVSIGERAFDSCQNLEYVEIPTTVSLIENNAFASCKKLDNITIPEGVLFIASKTFYMCLSLKSMILPASVTSISEEAFARCISLEEIAIGNDVVEIGEKAFMECYGLKRLSIGTGVEVIKWNTFAYCKSLEKVALTASLRSLEYGAFDSCPAITDVYFNESESLWHQINVKPTRNETLLRAKFHFNYTDSIVNVATPSPIEDIVAEVVETPIEEEKDEQVTLDVGDEIPAAEVETVDEPATVVDEPATAVADAVEAVDVTPSVSTGEQLTLIDAIPEVTTPAEPETVVEEPKTVEEPVKTPEKPKKPAVRTTPKSAQSTVSEAFKKAFYQTFLAKLDESDVAAYRAKAEAMTDESFETQSEALFLVPADDAYEFGCVCLCMERYNWAFRSFLSAAGKGSAYAQYYVGAAFLFGIDTTKKIVDAARWLTKCKKDEVFGADAEKLLVIVDEELDKPENAGLKVKRGNK